MRQNFNLTYENQCKAIYLRIPLILKLDYSQLRTKTGIIGIWDDHDYGVNDGDSRNPAKIRIKQIYLDYLDEP
jgi:hypothetical protein